MSEDDVAASSPGDTASDLAARANALEQRLNELQQHADKRLVRAEIKAEAIRAGIIDLDGLKLLDLSGVRLNENGEVEGGAEIIARFKSSKPWLFGPSSTSSSSSPPTSIPPRRKLASDMTEAEYREARAALLRHKV